ncbi:MAG: 5'-methylthioadenosine/S-adenosylhomocysteine nucleosidase, partial [bacterium]|nr:5'-methylthioadenosine/S-adenosylhomocysteine nucleosidase [bacterium]
MTTFNLDSRWLQAAQFFPVAEIEEALGGRPRARARQEQWLLDQLARKKGSPVRHPDRGTKCPDWKRVVQALRQKKLVTARGLALTQKGKNHQAELDLLHPDGPPEDPPFRIHVGPMATGNKVVRDKTLFRRLERVQRRVLAMEMEASAIGLVAHLRRLPWMIVA